MTKISTSFRRALATAATGALLAFAAPAFAADRPEPAKGEAASQPEGRDSSAGKKICLSNTVSGASTVTGSILQKRQCKTKAQWIAQGVQFERK
jgi:ABC-type sugar transport system substrate-binding protein